jgi:hypothetical protein
VGDEITTEVRSARIEIDRMGLIICAAMALAVAVDCGNRKDDTVSTGARIVSLWRRLASMD